MQFRRRLNALLNRIASFVAAMYDIFLRPIHKNYWVRLFQRPVWWVNSSGSIHRHWNFLTPFRGNVTTCPTKFCTYISLYTKYFPFLVDVYMPYRMTYHIYSLFIDLGMDMGILSWRMYLRWSATRWYPSGIYESLFGTLSSTHV